MALYSISSIEVEEKGPAGIKDTEKERKALSLRLSAWEMKLERQRNQSIYWLQYIQKKKRASDFKESKAFEHEKQKKEDSAWDEKQSV